MLRVVNVSLGRSFGVELLKILNSLLDDFNRIHYLLFIDDECGCKSKTEVMSSFGEETMVHQDISQIRSIYLSIMNNFKSAE